MSQETRKVAVTLCCERIGCGHRQRMIESREDTQKILPDGEGKLVKSTSEEDSPCVLSKTNLSNLPHIVLFWILKTCPDKDAIALAQCSKTLYAGLRDARPSLVVGLTASSLKESHAKLLALKACRDEYTIALARCSRSLSDRLGDVRPNLVQGVPEVVLKRSPATLESLPYDIIYKIFQASSRSRAVSLGLTSKRLYSFLKMAHPGPIRLNSNGLPSCFGLYRRGEDMLSDVIRRWLPANYRRTFTFDKPVHGHFVNVKVYGTFHSYKDDELCARYEDWATASVDGKFFDQKGFKSRLPYPYMKGKETWDVEAINIIQGDVGRFKSRAEWAKYWSKCKIFSRCVRVNTLDFSVVRKLSDK
ncbi:hypothetical protein VTL71DRAFT_5800 [Oculimacula yallundae]|uniref:F-box domain-containing protein n=1 Tax=Oculimacula yallundae TaxID=86028 RepID=A0ABR4BYK6_9HELO